jgi:hypothetical protein
LPTFYEGEPFAEFESAVTLRQYKKAYVLAQRSLGPLHKREVQVGLCLTAAALCAAATPSYAARYATFWVPVCFIAFMLALAVYFGFGQTRTLENTAEEQFSQNKLLSLPYKAVLYRDSFSVTNPYEQIRGYWTDSTLCLESDELFVLTGGWDRPLLVFSKEGLDENTLQSMSQNLASAFASRYRRVR